MPDFLQSVRDALAALEAQRRHIDTDLADLRRILERHTVGGGATPGPDTVTIDFPADMPPLPSPGGARAQMLELLASGPMTAGVLAKLRGTSRNAAYAVLQRMLDEEVPLIERVDGAYRLASPQGDAQGSLPASAESDSDELGQVD